MHSHYGIGTTTKMKIRTITLLLYDAYQKEIEDKLWQQWLAIYPNMGEENFISFQDYKEKCLKPELKKIDVKEILKDAEEIKRLDQEHYLQNN